MAEGNSTVTAEEFAAYLRVMHSQVEPMTAPAAMARHHFEGDIPGIASRQTNDFLKAINSLFQASKYRAQGCVLCRATRMVISLVTGTLEFPSLNPYAQLT